MAFTRLFNGRIAAFLVVGFVSVSIEPYSYHQALCVYVNTYSANSFFPTQHFSFVSKDTLQILLRNPVIIPISCRRLVFNRALLMPFYTSPTYYGLAYMKLCIRQCNYMGKSTWLDYYEKSSKERVIITRENKQQEENTN